ncbi:MAG: class II fumarate hydratase [Bacteroidales bacterium]|jgi:fumarate hydratase class II|nr:class II fumarate hydratase [Bacteroidales bacterium]
MNTYRIEHDILGEVQVPADAPWGAQTQRSLNNFKIGNEKMPIEIIYAIADIKKAAAFANHNSGILTKEKRDAIAQSCDAILEGKLNDAFPLVLWQTGSGTQTNMNLNEVIACYAKKITPPVELSPNDDVNKSQSTNDVFPTAMRLAAMKTVCEKLIPALESLIFTVTEKSKTFSEIKKIGRTHLMDATPFTLGEEFSAFAAQLVYGLTNINTAIIPLTSLPIGGTAIGNGINTPQGYDETVVHFINKFNHRRDEACYDSTVCQVSTNKFESMASQDAFVELSGALKRVAVSLMKIANDVKLLGSGPRCGFGELLLPENEPGSSIMPGKVNPTQCEALAMACCQVIGNDVAITVGAMQGQLQLNVFMPLIAKNILHSIHLLSDAMVSFNHNCIEGIVPNLKNMNKHLVSSLMRVTALSPVIGYENAAKIAQYAHKNDLTLKEAALELTLISEDVFDNIMQQ